MTSVFPLLLLVVATVVAVLDVLLPPRFIEPQVDEFLAGDVSLGAAAVTSTWKWGSHTGTDVHMSAWIQRCIRAGNQKQDQGHATLDGQNPWLEPWRADDAAS
jgi:hypothetical protein